MNKHQNLVEILADRYRKWGYTVETNILYAKGRINGEIDVLAYKDVKLENGGLRRYYRFGECKSSHRIKSYLTARKQFQRYKKIHKRQRVQRNGVYFTPELVRRMI